MHSRVGQIKCFKNSVCLSLQIDVCVWQIDEKQWKQRLTLFSWALKSLQMVIAAMKLKDACSLEESYDQLTQHIKKQRHY